MHQCWKSSTYDCPGETLASLMVTTNTVNMLWTEGIFCVSNESQNENFIPIKHDSLVIAGVALYEVHHLQYIHFCNVKPYHIVIVLSVSSKATRSSTNCCKLSSVWLLPVF